MHVYLVYFIPYVNKIKKVNIHSPKLALKHLVQHKSTYRYKLHKLFWCAP